MCRWPGREHMPQGVRGGGPCLRLCQCFSGPQIGDATSESDLFGRHQRLTTVGWQMPVRLQIGTVVSLSHRKPSYGSMGRVYSRVDLLD